MRNFSQPPFCFTATAYSCSGISCVSVNLEHRLNWRFVCKGKRRPREKHLSSPIVFSYFVVLSYETDHINHASLQHMQANCTQTGSTWWRNKSVKGSFQRTYRKNVTEVSPMDQFEMIICTKPNLDKQVVKTKPVHCPGFSSCLKHTIPSAQWTRHAASEQWTPPASFFCPNSSSCAHFWKRTTRN